MDVRTGLSVIMIILCMIGTLYVLWRAFRGQR